jgi:1-acyl-sn-glycerol-3-phosphate acyltransferase
MRIAYRVVTSAIHGALRALCQIGDEELVRVPDRGPLILVTNHINFLEVPLLYTHLQPRPLAGFAKAETWDNVTLAALADLWDAIPLQRGEADLGALRQALEALEEGHILTLSPEGTRSGDGRLQRAHSGVAFLALRSGAPLIPVAHHGGEQFWRKLRRLRRTEFNIVVGELFTLEADGVRVTQEVRQQMADEVMYQIAALLPPAYRGVYGDRAEATERHVRFPPGVGSNLERWEESSR